MPLFCLGFRLNILFRFSFKHFVQVFVQTFCLGSSLKYFVQVFVQTFCLGFSLKYFIQAFRSNILFRLFAQIFCLGFRSNILFRLFAQIFCLGFSFKYSFNDCYLKIFSVLIYNLINQNFRAYMFFFKWSGKPQG